jgi:hypothetical protein
MFRPVKRGFPPNGLEFGNLTEAQYNFNTAHVKRQRQAFDDRHNTVAVPNPCTVQQKTFSLNVSNFTDPQPTDILEPGCGVLFRGNADWAFNLQTDISDLPLLFSTSRHSGIPGYEFSAMLDPNFRYADGAVTGSDLQMTIDLSSKNSGTLTSDQGNSDDTLPQHINDGEQGPVQLIVCIA